MEPKNIDLAVTNIINFGDTDIFPYPIETRIFDDNKAGIIDLINKIDKDFYKYLSDSPPVNISACVPIGYTGFRWATQIDPIWNAYFLSLVLELAEKIEKVRIPKAKNVVFSYRFLPDFKEGSLFDKTVNWRSFQEHSIKKAQSADIKYVITCDIADFYTRIYHHRLENELDRIDANREVAPKIKKLIQTFSGTVSYVLPIGCPASRILAELSLNAVDSILQSQGVKFARFVDDYNIFCTSFEEAHSVLTFLSQKLMKNEGLTLQKHKTQIVSKEEFVKVTETKLVSSEEDDSVQKSKFMSLSVTYDPYSPTASQDYERIKEELKNFDLMGMLNDELRKSKINQPLSKHLMRAFAVSSEAVLSDAFILIADKLNLLYPIFSTVVLVACTHWERMRPDCKEKLKDKFLELARQDSYILKPETHAAFLCKLIAKNQLPENEELLVTLYGRNLSSPLITSLIIQIMAKWNKYYWISDLKRSFQTMDRWQRKTFIIASYILNDEGDHWRTHMKSQFSEFEEFYRDWAALRKQKNNLEAAL